MYGTQPCARIINVLMCAQQQQQQLQAPSQHQPGLGFLTVGQARTSPQERHATRAHQMDGASCAAALLIMSSCGWHQMDKKKGLCHLHLHRSG